MTRRLRAVLHAVSVASPAVVSLAALLAGNRMAAAVAGVTFAGQLLAAWHTRRGPRRPLRIPRRAG